MDVLCAGAVCQYGALRLSYIKGCDLQELAALLLSLQEGKLQLLLSCK